MTNLMSMARGRFKSKSRKSTSRTMARKSTRKSKSRRSSNSKGTSGVFSGKILGFKIPVISGFLGNKNVQKAIAGAGIVSLAISAATLINNPTINRALSNRFVRLGLAGAAGDVVGLGVEFAKSGGIATVQQAVGGRGGGQQSSLVSAAGNGIA